MQIFNGQTEDGVSEIFRVQRADELVNIWVSGDLGGGTVTVESLAPDGTTWVKVNGSEITEPLMITLEAPRFDARLRLADSTDANINAWAERDGIYWMSR